MHLLDESIRLLARDDPALDEPLRELRSHGRMASDARSHQRLRVRRLVLLVVSETPVADEVDDDVVAEAPPEREREPYGGDRSFGIVGVHVDDRRVETLGEVARVARRAPFLGLGREADLVVRDQVEGAPGRVPVQVREIERLGDDALSGKRRVAVDEDRQRDGGVVQALARRAVGLVGASLSLDDGVDGLEVARVRGERDVDLSALRRAPALCAEVVLDVAGPALGVRAHRLDHPLAFELTEDRLVRAPDDVREHVEPAAVRHPEHDLVRAGVRSEMNRLVEHRYEHVEPLDRELLLSEERLSQVGLQPLDLRQPRRAVRAPRRR